MPNTLRRFVESLESRTLLHAGDIDPAFNSGQLQTTSFANSGATASVVDTLPDGSFLVGGTTYQKQAGGLFGQAGIGIAKYNFDGTLDTTFGAAGEISGTPGGLYNLTQIVSTPDGGFLAVGTVQGNTPLIIKYTAAGAVDDTFGSDGEIRPDFFAQRPTQVAVDSDGRILVPGEIDNNAVLRRYASDGKVDTNFGIDGDYTEQAGTTVPEQYDERFFDAVAVNSDGYIVVTGDEYLHQTDQDTDHIIAETAVIREIKNDGTPIKQFDSNIDADNFTIQRYEDVAGILSNGNIILSGSNVIGLNADGTLNTYYGANGISGVIPDGQIAVEQDGSIITPFRVATDTTSEFALRRILPSGKLDKNFGTNGKLVLSSTSNSGEPLSIGVAIAPDGTAIAASQAGSLSPSGKVDTREFQVARVFTGNGPAVQLIPTTTKSSTNSRKVTVLIRDNDGIDTSTLDNNDLKFVDSDSLFLKMHFISFTPLDGNDYIQATYSISAPAVSIPGDSAVGWYPLDGNYQIRLAGSQIYDLLDNPAEAQILGTVTVNIPPAA